MLGLELLRTDTVPWVARRNYANELQHMSLWGVFAGTVDFGSGPLTSAGGSDLFLLRLPPSP